MNKTIIKALYHRLITSPYAIYTSEELSQLRIYSLLLADDFWIFVSIKYLLEDVINFRNETALGMFSSMRLRVWSRSQHEQILTDMDTILKLITNYLNGLKALKSEKNISEEDINELELTIHFCKKSILNRIQMLCEINDVFYICYQNLKLDWEQL